MAEVYKAFDVTLGRTVAVKVLHPRYAGEEDFVARFKREARAAANLNHPNIVNVYDWGAENGTYFLVMEYLVGKTLKEIITAEGPFAPSRTIDMAIQTAEALQFAHKHGIVHRDIKPQNIIFTDEGRVKVTDFGIARTMDANLTQTASIMGTAHYLSPEQAKSEHVGPPSDIYSLGVVLYEMATGNVPFEGDSPVSVALKHIQETPIAPGERVAGVPAELEAVIRKAMAKDPDQRYLTAGDLRDDLKNLAAGLPAQNAAESDNDRTMVLPPLPQTDVPERKARARDGARRSSRGWKIAGLVFLLAALFAGSALSTNLILNRTARVEVPEVIGMTIKEAKAVLAKKKLKLRTGSSVFDEKAPKGEILDQSPSGGKKTVQAGVVTVSVSKGKELIVVPDLRDKLLNEATLSLSERGLNVGSIRDDYSETVAENSVILQDPPAQGKVAKGTYVNLVISRGRQPLKTPNVIGKTVTEAKALIGAEGLTAAVEEEFDEDTEAGEVMSQSPAAGVPVGRGETVTLTVSKGPELISIPATSGNKEADAKQTLEAAGFTVKIDTSVTGPDSYGLVVTQSPEAGQKARRGALVTIWVGKKPVDKPLPKED